VNDTLTVVVRAAGSPFEGLGERSIHCRRIVATADDADLLVIDTGSTLESVLGVLNAGAGRLAVIVRRDRVAAAAAFALIKVVQERHPELPVSVLATRADATDGQAAYAAVDAACRQFLGRSVRYAGVLPDDADYRRDAARSGIIESAATGEAASAAEGILDSLITAQRAVASARLLAVLT
jgi:MinD-like ATPase involved in chromosome partitioning or flagellar assembly